MGKSKSSKGESSKKDPTVEKTNVSTRPSISKSVIFKLLGFSALLFFAPIATYFYSVDSVFNGNTTYAAGAAALVANLVVIAYILVAMVEDMNSVKVDKAD